MATPDLRQFGCGLNVPKTALQRTGLVPTIRPRREVLMSYEQDFADRPGWNDFSDEQVETVPHADEEPIWSSPRLLDIFVGMAMFVVLCAVPGMCGMDTEGGTVFLFAVASLFIFGSFTFGLIRLVRCGDGKEEKHSEPEEEA